MIPWKKVQGWVKFPSYTDESGRKYLGTTYYCDIEILSESCISVDLRNMQVDEHNYFLWSEGYEYVQKEIVVNINGVEKTYFTTQEVEKNLYLARK